MVACNRAVFSQPGSLSRAHIKVGYGPKCARASFETLMWARYTDPGIQNTVPLPITIQILKIPIHTGLYNDAHSEKYIPVIVPVLLCKNI